MKSLKMALVGGESYGMRIQLKFKETYCVIKSILDLQVGKASGSDASYTYQHSSD
jgi:hypothetical protein